MTANPIALSKADYALLDGIASENYRVVTPIGHGWFMTYAYRDRIQGLLNAHLIEADELSNIDPKRALVFGDGVKVYHLTPDGERAVKRQY